MTKQKTKAEIVENLKGEIRAIKALMKDINSWDIYDDDNWKCMIEDLQEAIKFIEKKK